MPFSTTPIQEQHGLRFACTTLLLSWLTAFGPLCTDMYLPTLPDIAADLSISTALAQSSITSCLLGLALGQLFVGPISDSRGRHGVLVLSLVLYTVASFLCTQAEDGTSFIVLRFLQGFGGAGGAVLARAVCCDIFHGSKLTQYISLLNHETGRFSVVKTVSGYGDLSVLSYKTYRCPVDIHYCFSFA